MAGRGSPCWPPLTSPCTGTAAWPRCSTAGRPTPHTWDTRPCARKMPAGKEDPPHRRDPQVPKTFFFYANRVIFPLSFIKGGNFEI